MTLDAFVERYDLHDSILNRIVYSEAEHTLTLLIDFAFWMQDDYIDGCPETGPVEITFYNVKEYRGPSSIPQEQCSILNCDCINGRIKIGILNDITDEFYESLFWANDVEFAVIAQDNSV